MQTKGHIKILTLSNVCTLSNYLDIKSWLNSCVSVCDHSNQERISNEPLAASDKCSRCNVSDMSFRLYKNGSIVSIAH